MHSHENKAVESGETKRPDPPSEDTESSRRSKRSKYAAVAWYGLINVDVETTEYLLTKLVQ